MRWPPLVAACMPDELGNRLAARSLSREQKHPGSGCREDARTGTKDVANKQGRLRSLKHYTLKSRRPFFRLSACRLFGFYARFVYSPLRSLLPLSLLSSAPTRRGQLGEPLCVRQRQPRRPCLKAPFGRFSEHCRRPRTIQRELVLPCTRPPSLLPSVHPHRSGLDICDYAFRQCARRLRGAILMCRVGLEGP